MDSVERLVLQVLNSQAIRDAEKDARSFEQEILKTNADLKAGAISADAYAQHVAAMGAKLKATQTTIEGLQKASKDYRQNITALGYAVQDFASASGGLGQRLNSIANNLPGIFNGLGNVGLVLSALTPAFALVVTNWDSLVKAFGSGVDTIKDNLKRLEDRIKELEAKPVKLAVDTLELDNAHRQVEEIRAALDAVQRLSKTRGHFERESGAQIEEAFAHATDAADTDVRNAKPITADEVRGKLRADMAKDLLAADKTIADANQKQAAIDAKVAQLTVKAQQFANEGTAAGARVADDIQQQIEGLKKERAKLGEAAKTAALNITKDEGAADTEVGKILEQAERGAGAAQRGAQQKLIDRLKRAGLGALATSVEFSSPEHVEAADAAEDALQRGNERAEQARRRGADQTAKGLAAANRGGDLDRAARDLAVTARDKEMSPQEQFDYILRGLKQAMTEALDQQGIRNVRPEAIAAQAKPLAAQAMGAAKAEALARQAAAPAADAAKINEANAKAAQDRKDLEAGLGPELMAAIERSMLNLRLLRISPESRKKRQTEQSLNLRNVVTRQLLAGGMEGGRAADLGMSAEQLLNQDITEQANRIRTMQPRKAKPITDREIAQMIINGQVPGAQAPAEGGGGGMRSIPPVGDNDGPGQVPKPKPAPGGGEFTVPAVPAAAGFDAAQVRAYFAESQAVMAQQAAALQQFQGMFGAARMGIQQVWQIQKRAMSGGQANNYPAMPESF